MISISLPNSNPFVIGEALATKQAGITLEPFITADANDICYCEFECEYIEPVFADAGGDWWKNDITSFLFKKWITGDTITLKLFKNNVEIATISDDTYGTFYPAGSFAAQPLYIGFVLDWLKVFTVEGHGLYHIKAEQTIMGTANDFESRKFKLLPYSDELANETVRIESYQTGNIIKSLFDYTGLLPDGWYQSTRVRGKFGNKQHIFEQDTYLNQQYETKQIRDKVSVEWDLEARFVPAGVLNMLTEDNFLSNSLLITDYNFLNNEIYRRINVYPVEFSAIEHFANNRKSNILIKFTNRIDNIIKSNF